MRVWILAYWTLRRLLAEWTEFGSCVRESWKNEGSDPEEEKNFLRLKGRMASRLAWLATLEPSGKVGGFPETLAAMTELLGRYRSIAPESDKKATSKDDFEHLWHEYFIFLSQLRGVRLRTETEVKEDLRASMPERRHSRKSDSKRKRSIVVRTLPLFSIALVGGLLYVAGSAVGLRWSEGAFTAEKPSSLPDVLNNIIAGLMGVWQWTLGFLEPIIISYGAVWTAIMMGLLLTAGFYLAFARR